MYKLKYKMADNLKQVEEFATVQEVAERIKQLFDGETVADILRIKKEYNIRIYLTFKKN